MKITIHRGTHQIGGCITEIESNGYKIFIDFVEQLPGNESTDADLPAIEGLTCGDILKSALFITHYHGDHIEKISETVNDLPIYAGKTALEIYKCFENRLSYIPDAKEADKHQKNIERIKTMNVFEALQEIKIGEITVIPLFTDHSAFDAYMFIVEAEGRRMLHTGDFRGHGFRRKGLIPMLKKYAKDIDYIISEGTNILRPDVTIQTEQELQREFGKKFKNYKYNFVFVSSTNIDRIFALYHAAKRAGRCFVCDDYQADMLRIVSKNHKERSAFYDIDYEQKTRHGGRFFELKKHGGQPFSFGENLKKYLDNYGFCMIIRSNPAFKSLLDEYTKNADTKIYYSMWKGYIDDKNPAFNDRTANFFKPYEIEFMHTSGHADIETLKNVFDTVNPKCGIIPIHTEAPEKFYELFSPHKIIPIEDGKSFET
jgi:ribonuclease J